MSTIEQIKELGYYKEFERAVYHLGTPSMVEVSENNLGLSDIFNWKDSQEGSCFWNELDDLITFEHYKSFKTFDDLDHYYNINYKN